MASPVAPVPLVVHDVANIIGPVIGIVATLSTAVLTSGLVPPTVAKILTPVLGGVFSLFAAKAVAVQSTPLVSPAKDAPRLPSGLVSRLVGGIF